MAIKKARIQQATRPDFISNFESLRRREKAEKAGVTEEEQALYAMSSSEGWRHFNNKAQLLITDLDAWVEGAIQQGATKEQIGENTIVVTMVKQVIRALLNTVNDAIEAVEPK